MSVVKFEGYRTVVPVVQFYFKKEAKIKGIFFYCHVGQSFNTSAEEVQYSCGKVVLTVGRVLASVEVQNSNVLYGPLVLVVQDSCITSTSGAGFLHHKYLWYRIPASVFSVPGTVQSSGTWITQF